MHAGERFQVTFARGCSSMPMGFLEDTPRIAWYISAPWPAQALDPDPVAVHAEPSSSLGRMNAWYGQKWAGLSSCV